MKLKSVLIIALLPALLSSCLKSRDSLGVINDGGSISTGIFDAFYYGQLKPLALNALPVQETIDEFILVRYSAPRTKAGTVHAKLVIDNTLVTNYNTANGTSFVILPQNAYTLPAGLEFDMPAGNYAEFPFPVRLDKSALNLQNVYAIGIRLSSATPGVVSANEASIIVSILVKNQYHGTYHAIGYFYHPSSPRDIDQDKDLTTTGPYSVKCDLGDLGGAGYKAIFTVDPATNNVNIVAAPGASGGVYTMWTSGLPTTNPGYTPQWPGSPLCNNVYNPGNKTFYVRYGYTGGTGYRVTEESIIRY